MYPIAQLRKGKKISQVELAKMLNVTQGAISQWENGDSNPAINKLPQIANVLGCTIDQLFQKEEKRA